MFRCYQEDSPKTTSVLTVLDIKEVISPSLKSLIKKGVSVMHTSICQLGVQISDQSNLHVHA